MSLLDRAVSFALPAVPRPIVRLFSKRYIAGTGVDDAVRVVRALEHEGAMATLDILGEFISSPGEAESNTRGYESLYDTIAARGLTQTNVSVKLTALGLLLDERLCLDNMRRLMAQVDRHDSFLRIDMEDSRCTTATIGIYRTLRSEFPGRVGVALQSRLRRTLGDVDALSGAPGNYRLCKGIYLEPPDIAFTDADEIRRNYTASLERMFERGAYVGIATHDDVLVREALGLIDRFELDRSAYEFQMLLGVTEGLRRELIASGHRLRVYVPFGEQWYPYSVRRLRENPQIAGHAFRAMFRRE